MSIAPMVHPGTQQRDTMGSIADSADLPSLSPSSSFLESPSSSLSQDIEGSASHIVGSLSRSPSGLLARQHHPVCCLARDVTTTLAGVEWTALLAEGKPSHIPLSSGCQSRG